MNLDISNLFYTIYLSIRKAQLLNDILIFVQSLAEAMFLTDLELNTVSLFTSLMSFSVCCCMTFLFSHPFHAAFCYFTGWLRTKLWLLTEGAISAANSCFISIVEWLFCDCGLSLYSLYTSATKSDIYLCKNGILTVV